MPTRRTPAGQGDVLLALDVPGRASRRPSLAVVWCARWARVRCHPYEDELAKARSSLHVKGIGDGSGCARTRLCPFPVTGSRDTGSESFTRANWGVSGGSRESWTMIKLLNPGSAY